MLGVAILTRDRPEEFEKTLKYHEPLLASYQVPLYVFDNSVNTDNSKLLISHTYMKYHKHDNDLTYDQSFRYALEHVKEDYVWVISDRLGICIGSIPLIVDYLRRAIFSAVLVGCNARLALIGNPEVMADREAFLVKYAWHSTLCGSTIYHKDTITHAEKDKYMEHGFIQTAVLLDGILKNLNPTLILPMSLTYPFTDMTPRWLPKYIPIWCKELYEMMMKLPDQYSIEGRVAFCNNNGFNGTLLNENQMKMLAMHGYLTQKVIDEYLPWIQKVCSIPEGRLRQIAIG